MKRIITYIAAVFSAVAIVSCARKPAQMTEYVLGWAGDGLAVKVNVSSPKDTVVYVYDEPVGGITDQLDWFQDFVITKGRVLVDSTERTFSVIPENGKASFSYVVRCKLDKDYWSPDGSIRDMFCPDIDSTMLYGHGGDFFVEALLPDGTMDEEMPVSVEWQSLPPYPVFCLYNSGNGTDRFEGKMGQIVSSVIVGDPLLSVDTVSVGGHENYLVTALRKDVEENKEELKAYFRKAYGALTAFWNDPQDQPFSLVLFPFRNSLFDISGNGFENGFLCRYCTTAERIMTEEVRNTFTHEIGHKWIGNGPSWFGEGFNEMQTGYQLVKSGLVEPEYFADYFNIALEGLYHNPHRNATGEEAEEKFWDDGQYTWLLYWRGYCYAFHLAGQIERSTGKANAYSVMMDALKPDILDMNEEKFLEDMTKVLDRDILESEYKKYIHDGKDFVWNPDELPSGCTITYENGVPHMKITDMDLFRKHFE